MIRIHSSVHDVNLSISPFNHLSFSSRKQEKANIKTNLGKAFVLTELVCGPKSIDIEKTISDLNSDDVATRIKAALHLRQELDKQHSEITNKDIEKLLPQLALSLKDKNEQVRNYIAKVTSKSEVINKIIETKQEDVFISSLIQILNNTGEMPDNLICAISTLSRFGPKAKEAVPAIGFYLSESLEKAKNSEHYAKIIYSSIVTLGAIGKDCAKEVTPLLLKCLNYPTNNNNFKDSAINALGELGPGAEEAVPDLIKIALKSSNDLDFWAKVALGKIGTPAVYGLIRYIKNRWVVI